MSVETCTYRDDDVLAWVLGDLSEERETDLACHLAACPGCRERAAEYRALDRSAGACRGGPVIRWRGFSSPFGPMRIAASREGLVELSWRLSEGDFISGLEQRFRQAPVVCDCGELEEAEDQLQDYFDRRRRDFDLPVDLSGLTGFQRDVLGAAAALGFGEVSTYSELARRIGKPGASRAVGNALGRNPVAIVVPCHRVIRTDGSLGGYTGGLDYKRVLLDIEGRGDLLGEAPQPSLPL